MGNDKEAKVEAESKAPAAPTPVANQPVSPADKGAPNAPLIFQLDTLGRSSPYFAKNGDSPRRPSRWKTNGQFHCRIFRMNFSVTSANN